MAVTKKKAASAAAAVAVAAALALGGTFAWQSISQEALNEASDVVNPGGRLHDDFNGENKDVYVENFADDPIFARVRLDEYFEIVMNKGAGDAEKTEVVTNGATKGELDTYVTHLFDGTNATDEYWEWATGGSTIYMPTFNKDKDSLKADINGTYNGSDGVVTDADDDDRYADYVEYADGGTEAEDAVYDADTDSLDNGGTKSVGEEHTAKETLDAQLISMEEWKTTYNSEPGEYWVYDTDGWVYWAQPIAPDTATGLLLDGIEQTQVMDDSWYYAINVVAQFVTANDVGKADNTGFYADEDLDGTADSAPTAEAEALLKAIGVEIPITSEADLEAALRKGGNINLGDASIAVETAESNGLNFNYDLLMSEGGTLSGGTINSETGSYATLLINNENNWPVVGDGASAAILEDTTINTQSTFGVYAQPIAAPVTLENVTINGAVGGFYAEYAGETVTLENVTVDAEGTGGAKPWFNSAVAAGMGANVVVNSGSYTGEYAAYVYSSGATLTINGGYFDGKLKQDNAALVIKGGTFTADPTEFVADGYEVVYSEDDETWTVSEKATAGLTYTVVSPENWDGALARRGENTATFKIDGDYSADDLEWTCISGDGAKCWDDTAAVTENDDGTATAKHTGMICGGVGFTIRASLTSDPNVYVDIYIECDTE